MDTRTMKWQRIGTTVLIVHAGLLPDPVEWNQFIADCLTMGVLAKRAIVFAGVTLNADQRRDIQEVHRQCGTEAVAVITHSLLTRVLVTTMNWLSNKHRAFTPDEVVAAFDYLDVNDDERVELLAAALRFARELKLTQLETSLGAQ